MSGTSEGHYVLHQHCTCCIDDLQRLRALCKQAGEVLGFMHRGNAKACSGFPAPGIPCVLCEFVDRLQAAGKEDQA